MLVLPERPGLEAGSIALKNLLIKRFQQPLNASDESVEAALRSVEQILISMTTGAYDPETGLGEQVQPQGAWHGVLHIDAKGNPYYAWSGLELGPLPLGAPEQAPANK